jgi:hypothetical protein
MASVVRRPHRVRNWFIIVRSLFEYSKLRVFDAQNYLRVNDLYSSIDKGIPSNDDVLDYDFSSDRLLDERIAPGHKNHVQMTFSRLSQWALAEYYAGLFVQRVKRCRITMFRPANFFSQPSIHSACSTRLS